MTRMKNLFGEEIPEQAPKKRSRAEVFNDYDSFVEKFKPKKKTTDDCYTPPAIYDAVCRWVNDNLLPLDGVEIVRPFYPGGDYERFDYPEGCLVLDNPPFSILAKIRRFYHARGIRYFLFAPTLTMASGAKELDDETLIISGVSLFYDNGARVATSFITNLPSGNIRVWCAGTLTKLLKEANSKNRRAARAILQKYEYPLHVISPAIMWRLAARGIELRIRKADCVALTGLDAQRKCGKSVFGGGWLLSERAAAERAAAERAAAEPNMVWTLSPRELEIIKRLSNPEQQ